MSKKKLSLLSFFITSVYSIIPTIAVNSTDYHRLFSFPIQVFGYFSTGHFQFFLWNAVFNYFVFYFFLRIIVKLFLKYIDKGSS